MNEAGNPVASERGDANAQTDIWEYLSANESDFAEADGYAWLEEEQYQN